jgi:hypothetical protein
MSSIDLIVPPFNEVWSQEDVKNSPTQRGGLNAWRRAASTQENDDVRRIPCAKKLKREINLHAAPSASL